MAELARREVARLAGRRAVRALAADAGDHPGGGDAGGLRRRRRPRLDRLRDAADEPDRGWMNDDRATWRKLALFGPALARTAAAAGARRWSRSRRRCWTRSGGAAPKARTARTDVVSMLVEARYEDGSPLSEKELRDELLTLLTDGPTSSSLAWAFERLLRHPEKLGAPAGGGPRRRGRGLPRRGDQGDAAAAAAGPGRRPPPAASRRRWAATTFPAGTLVAPCVHLIHHSARDLRRARQASSPSASSSGAPRCLHLDPLRRRRPPLPRRQLRRNGDEAGAAHRARGGRAGPVESRAERVRKSAIAFSPAQHGLVVARAPDPRLRMSADTTSSSSAPAPRPRRSRPRSTSINSLGLAQISMTVIEGTEPAASWLGRNGMTSGEEPLAVTPIKDVGFPYQSHASSARPARRSTRRSLPFTWQRYMIGAPRIRRAGSTPARPRCATATTASTWPGCSRGRPRG